MCSVLFRLWPAMIIAAKPLAWALPQAHRFNVFVDKFSYDEFLIGTMNFSVRVTFSFASPDLEVLGFLCLRDFYCKGYCDLPQFCRLYCNPLCCTSKTLRELRCTHDRPPNAYPLNSTEFKFLPEPWKSVTGASVGFYGEDAIVLKDGVSSGEMTVTGAKFALNLITGLNDRMETMEVTNPNKIGLRRRAFNESFVNDLFIAGIIPAPILTVGYSYHPATRDITFGRHVKEHCGKYNAIDLKNRVEFMFDGVDVEFMSYKARQDYRMMISETDMFSISSSVFNDLINSGIISSKHDYYQVYYVHAKVAQNFTWTLPDSFQIDLEDYNVVREYFLSRTIIIRTIHPNPDNLQWILGSTVFLEYCMYIDYGKNVMGFANCLTCGNTGQNG